jgi:outer membrane autotransporter protein
LTQTGDVYVEPIISLSYVNTRFDNFTGLGLTTSYQNGYSFLGGAGARFGALWVNTAAYEVDSSVTVKVWDRFNSNNGLTLSTIGPTVTLNDNVSPVFGELAAQVNITSKVTGWSGFMNWGVKASSEFYTLTAKLGALYHW